MGNLLLTCVLTLILFGTANAGAETAADKKETVVLVHGMGRSRMSLYLLEHRLKKTGYATLNFPYNHQNKRMDELSDALSAFVEEHLTTERYHYIAHSLGNIIIRNGFKKGQPEGLGRIVMLAPPNQPAALAKQLHGNPVYQWINGEPGQRLASDEFYDDLPVPDVDFGIIAGDKGQSLTFDAPNDGIVLVDNTKLEGMAGFLLVHRAHTFIMNSKEVFRQCVHFLEQGSFLQETE